MKIITKSHFYLTKAEKDVLSAAERILNEVWTAIHREEPSFDWCNFDNYDISLAQEIIADLNENAEEEDEDD